MSGSFLRASGACWIASAFTTLALIFLPRFVPIAPDLDSQARLAHDPVYITRVWVSLVHPLIVLVGALGVLYARFRERPGSASTGFLFFSLWAFTEAIQASLTIVALNWTWRPKYLAAHDKAVRDALQVQITGFDAVWDGLFFVLVIAFIIANLLFAVAVHGPCAAAMGLRRLCAGRRTRNHQPGHEFRRRHPAGAGDGRPVSRPSASSQVPDGAMAPSAESR